VSAHIISATRAKIEGCKNPIEGNPFATRGDFARAVRDICSPTLPMLSPGGARLRLGKTAATYEMVTAELEGYARLLWGIVPLIAGGSAYDEALPRILQGLASGTDPDNPEFWGIPGGDQRGAKDQRLVEMAPIGLALAMAPEKFWEPLSAATKANLTRWLETCLTRPYNDNNWRFFRVLVALGLEKVGHSFDRQPVEDHLARLESFYVADGWYEDGTTRRYDHYIAFAMHFYGLIYARLHGDKDPERAARMVDRAKQFAGDYLYWFGRDGSAIPYGRSLTYRFAHASFWGALAFADVEALPWGQIRGLVARNMRWWSKQPIGDENGVIKLGYAYPNNLMLEEYSADGSPFWALKAFMPLALPAEHPFWTASEEEHPLDDSASSLQPHAKMLLYRNEGHAIAVSGGQSVVRHRNSPAKYSKLAYSSHSGFSVELDLRSAEHGAFDNSLVVREAGDGLWRARETSEVEAMAGALISRWRPLAGVEIESHALVAAPWHIRVHRIRTDRRIETLEGGFSVERVEDDFTVNHNTSRETGDYCAAIFPTGCSLIADLAGNRTGQMLYAAPNTNVMFMRTGIPTLVTTLEPGETVIACAVTSSEAADRIEALIAALPELGRRFAQLDLGG